MADATRQPEVKKAKHAGGRPLKYKTPEALQKAVDAYFEETGPKSVFGLAISLDMEARSLIEYQERDQFFPIITRAKDRIKRYYDEVVGQGGKAGHFGDRMITRMGCPCIEKSEVDIPGFDLVLGRKDARHSGK